MRDLQGPAPESRDLEELQVRKAIEALTETEREELARQILDREKAMRQRYRGQYR